ncbi:MAG: hypothetical protein JRG70_09625, partial [Deltaproteobacteria bacterium]|nr:hypothetical protein [Deltaproteobacteria bacterium]
MSTKVRRARWEENLDADPHLRPSKLFEDAGYQLSRHDGYLWADGFACPECGTQHRTAAATPSCKILAGTYGGGYTVESTSRVTCVACGKWLVRSSGLVQVLHPAPTKRLTYLEQRCRGAEPKMARFVAARAEGSVSLRTTAQAAALAALPPEHTGAVELCMIEALDEAQ